MFDVHLPCVELTRRKWILVGKNSPCMTICVTLLTQVSREIYGKAVDSKCHSLTASYVREKREKDPSVPGCDFFEVYG